LRHIGDACDRIARYTAEGRLSLDDERTYDAVLRCLTIIGEALGAVSEDTYSLLQSLPRHRPKAQRNLIVHEYWCVDVEVIWETAARAVPALRADVKRVLAR
jgi:uncharacterized protein with HEPN domain